MYAWDDLRVFLAVARAGTLSAAASSLGMDATTAGRRISSLESSASVQLFRRTRTGFSLTPAGERLLPHAVRIEAEIIAADRELSGADEALSGPLRLTAGDGLTAMILAPALVQLRRRNPALLIELRADNRAVDLSRREADIAVRLFRPRERTLVARRLFTFTEGLYASPQYLHERGTPATVRELGPHDFIGPAPDLDQLPHWHFLRRSVPDLRIPLRCNSTMGQMAACAAGHGLLVLPTLLGDRDPRLTRVLPRLEFPRREAWAVVHEDLRKNARVVTVLAWLVELFATVRVPEVRH